MEEVPRPVTPDAGSHQSGNLIPFSDNHEVCYSCWRRDGGLPLDELDGRTPLQVADKPTWTPCGDGCMWPPQDSPRGDGGWFRCRKPQHNGLRPPQVLHREGPLEAASIGVELGDEDVAFRCNLINADERIVDFNAGHIETAEQLGS